jgi:hypothetical protein
VSETAPITLVYLMGHGYSGSTLVTMLLNAHPAIATVGEMGIAQQSDPDPSLFRCSCRALVGDCPFWRRVTSEMAALGYPFDIRAGGLLFPYTNTLPDRLLTAYTRGYLFERFRALGIACHPAARRLRAEVLARNRAFVQVATTMKGCHVFVDSSKRPERALHLRHMRDVRLKVVHVIRDGRAVANSCVKNLGVHPSEGAKSWLRDLRSTERTRRFFAPEDWLTVRYEDLCVDLDGTLATLFAFIGVPPADVSDFRRREHHVIGNRMRLAAAPEVRLDDSWRRELPRSERDRVSRLVAGINARYGYAGG